MLSRVARAQGPPFFRVPLGPCTMLASPFGFSIVFRYASVDKTAPAGNNSEKIILAGLHVWLGP